jgi:hypothetical protein
MSSPDGAERRRTAIGQLSTLQQRFEESRTGQVMISGLVAAILFVGAAWNLPTSPIKRSIVPVLKPTAVVNLNQTWSVYAPSPIDRLNTVEVQVRMADGASRVWTLEPGTRMDRLFASSHWEKLVEYVVLDANARQGVARWVARKLTGPSQRAVGVVMLLRTKSLSPPGEDASTATATKVLYQEDLTAAQR